MKTLFRQVTSLLTYELLPETETTHGIVMGVVLALFILTLICRG